MKEKPKISENKTKKKRPAYTEMKCCIMQGGKGQKGKRKKKEEEINDTVW